MNPTIDRMLLAFDPCIFHLQNHKKKYHKHSLRVCRPLLQEWSNKRKQDRQFRQVAANSKKRHNPQATSFDLYAEDENMVSRHIFDII